MRRGPLRHTWFAAFTAAIGLGSIADEVARLALPLLVLDLTHSIAAAVPLRVVQSVPYILSERPPEHSSTEWTSADSSSPATSRVSR